MVERYTRETFSMDVIPNGFLKETRDLVKEAVNDYAWELSVKGMTMALHAPDSSEKRIPFSASNRREPIQAHRRTIRKHGFRRKKTAVREAVERAIDKKETPAEPYVVDVGPMIATRGGKRSSGPVRYESHTANQRTWSDGHVDYTCSVDGCGYTGDKPSSMGSHYRKHVLAGEVEKRQERQPDLPMNTSIDPNRTLVSVEPMMAKRGSRAGGSYLYESKVAKKQTWSDGSVDYICSIEGCGYVGGSPLSMSSHWRKHIHSGEAKAMPQAERVATVVKGEPYEPVYVRSEKTQALAVVLQKRLESGAIDWSDPAAAALSLAEESLSWVRQHIMRAPEAGTSDADAIVEQVRLLVGGADKGEVEALTAQVSELQSTMEEVKADRDRVKGNLHALREMLAEADEEQAS